MSGGAGAGDGSGGSASVRLDARAAACLIGAITSCLLLRVPLILNAPSHLDSDLAVDGLTLIDALRGHWRWHYPGTPFSGSLAVLLSLPQAMAWGATPWTLVSGGAVAHILLLVGAFGLAWSAFGRGPALWSLIPLTFASTGMIWLSGRITGGHLLVAGWSAWAWVLWIGFVRGRESKSRSLALGVWCGLGLYIDSMFLMTLVGLVVGTAAALLRAGAGPEGQRSRPGTPALALLVAGFLLGASPRWIGAWLDPHDPYHEQFAGSLDPPVLMQHARILLLECLPRLVAGHRLPGFEADPDPARLGEGGPLWTGDAARKAVGWIAYPTTAMAIGLALAASWALASASLRHRDAASRSMAAGLIAASLAIAGAFLINRNIFNADNYRYLVLWLVPWALGSGLVLDRLASRPRAGRLLAASFAVAYAALFTSDAASWYRHLGWLGDGLLPVRRRVDDPALRWLEDHPDVRAIFGGYWDVYRLSFLRGGSVRGVPFSMFPDRFPEWSAAMPGGRPSILVARRTPEGQQFVKSALRDGAKVLHRDGRVTILDWPATGSGGARSAR
ncbi:hypothetical protein OJF2_53740 [Aquisphaera giovannonii]|uniref:Glycosyltransferase RgtA/B/C/D-like domain-containing protein n=1 Tax=Aquisphaera giovannonii TaxID=406548 RepID=A0A5B9W986_9BACT|nr:hypothetical protein [Aquisphaera giovannonii]QEH36789.1 hypothetical protein OJF2_53740 [Aquisphaera giovannonii]